MLFCILLQGCAPSEEDEKGSSEVDRRPIMPIRYGGTYTLPLRFNPTTLDPAHLHDWNGYFIAQQLFEGLVQFGPHLTVLPALAESWQVEDEGRVYRFFLTKSAQFHNNQPVTVEDVVFTIQRLLRIDPPPAILPHLLKIDGAEAYHHKKSNHLKGLQIAGKHILTVRLTQPHAPFLTALGMYQAAIVPRTEILKNETAFGRRPIGSGPFKFVTWKRNQSIRLERFKQYHAGAAFLDAVKFCIYPGGDLERMFSDFKAERLMEIPAHGFIKQALAEKKDLRWFQRPSLGLLFYGIRSKSHPLLGNSDFRKALMLAIDYDRLATKAYRGQFDPAHTVLPPGLPGLERKRPPRKGRWAQAKKLFNQAIAETPGVEPRIEIVSAIASPLSKAELACVQSFWTQLGVTVDVKFITDWEKFEAYLKSDAAQVYRYAWLADMPDADSILYPLFGSDSPVNYAGYASDKVDRLLSEACGMIDPLARAQIYGKIERLAMADVPIIPLVYLNVDRVYHDIVQGMEVSALGFQSTPLHRVWLKTGVEKK